MISLGPTTVGPSPNKATRWEKMRFCLGGDTQPSSRLCSVQMVLLDLSSEAKIGLQVVAIRGR